MARLIIKTEGLGKQALELRMGVNRVGREDNCELHLPHSTVSSLHAELSLSDDGVHLRDCDSTNGTFINGRPCADAWLEPGQQLRFGDVELLVESTTAVVAIPQYDRTEPPPPAPVILEDGRTACPRHSHIPATFRCTYCKEMMCNGCVKVMRLKGRAPHYLCRLCSHPAERIEVAAPKKKKGFFAMLETVKLKFTHPHQHKPPE
ncbi:MAG: FHA domain-containing protein [Verrucomicrobiae bacterium]|nr:FHA domain-containing protein [Verrucomicrobiae bacterium]